MAESHPQIHVVAGPNGAGKTTFARGYLPEYAGCLQFVNADLIAAGLSPFAPESAAVTAGRLVLQQIHRLAGQRVNFAFETTLAGRGYQAMLQTFKQQGYVVSLYFLWLPTVQLALERIAVRVRGGGHNVPEEDVRRRYRRGIRNLFQVYRPLLDSWVVYDNSRIFPRAVAVEHAGALSIVDQHTFRRVLEAVQQP
jgi:predicted ABC-type ATPase